MIADMDDWAWLGTIEWNLNAAFYATRRALKYMVPQGSGRIINISSVEGKQANKPAVSNYITTKHALNGLTKATAFEYGPMGITCNAICPGAIETDIMRESGPGRGRDGRHHVRAVPPELRQRVDDQAAQQGGGGGRRWPCSSPPTAGAGITGALLNVDGGSAPW